MQNLCRARKCPSIVKLVRLGNTGCHSDKLQHNRQANRLAERGHKSGLYKKDAEHKAIAMQTLILLQM